MLIENVWTEWAHERDGSLIVSVGGSDGTTSEKLFIHTSSWCRFSEIIIKWIPFQLDFFLSRTIARKSTRIEFNSVPIFLSLSLFRFFILTYNIFVFSWKTLSLEINVFPYNFEFFKLNQKFYYFYQVYSENIEIKDTENNTESKSNRIFYFFVCIDILSLPIEQTIHNS